MDNCDNVTQENVLLLLMRFGQIYLIGVYHMPVQHFRGSKFTVPKEWILEYVPVGQPAKN